jgi:hypothetical protein
LNGIWILFIVEFGTWSARVKPIVIGDRRHDRLAHVILNRLFRWWVCQICKVMEHALGQVRLSALIVEVHLTDQGLVVRWAAVLLRVSYLTSLCALHMLWHLFLSVA